MELNSVKYVFLLIWFSVSFITSVMLFGRGLLLNRDVLPYRTKCIRDVSNVCYTDNTVDNLNECLNKINATLTDQYCSASDYKVVLIIIDALRYDFTTFNNSSVTDLPYENKLSVIHDLLKMYPNRSRLYKFIADPPTTTMQRINGLTTGSLPTFIDVGSNFASSEINEDNIIDQVISNNKSVVFMGDDTWVKIYPDRFVRSYPYDSFNVWDLDTVDKGVKMHLFPELQKNDWSLLIAHFLGIDHCGHRYGMNHPEMARKLGEMNDVLRDVIKELQTRDDTLLFVIGDHGMTVTGDHGGETMEEISSALFVYSPQHELTIEDGDSAIVGTIKRQVDLVPTLSSILGNAIPFSNTGSFILDCLPISLTNSPFKLASLLLRNVEQLINYVKLYSSRSGQFIASELDSLLGDYSILKTDLIAFTQDRISDTNDRLLQSALKRYRTFVRLISNMTQRAWVQFDMTAILFGLVSSFSILLFSFLVLSLLLPGAADTFDKVFTGPRVVGFCLVLPALALAVTYMLYASEFIVRPELTFYFFVGLFYVALLCGVTFKTFPFIVLFAPLSYIRQIRLPFAVTFASVCYLLSSVALFSNSFILRESSLIGYLSVSCLSVATASYFKYGSSVLKEKPSLNRFKTLIANLTGRTLRNKAYAISFLVCICMRLGSLYAICRAASDENNGIIACQDEKQMMAHCLAAVFLLNSYLAVVRRLMQYNGNQCGNLLNIIVCSAVPKMNAILISMYWVLECSFPLHNFNYYSLIAKTPTAVLISSLISLLYLSYDTLSVRCDRGDSSSSCVTAGGGSVAFHFSQFIRHQVADYSEHVNGIQGATTIYNAFFANITNFAVIISCVLLGQRYASAAILMSITLWMLIFVTTVCRYNIASSVSANTCDVSWKYVILWGMSCIFWFHNTGHDASFNGIQWNAAFILYKDIGNRMIIPGILILFNTFCSYIIHTILLPMLLIYPFTINGFQPNLLPDSNNEKDLCNELALVHNTHVFHRGVYFLYMKYLLFFAARLFVMMISATIHCRHLMMWRIFAPKLIFEATAFVVAVVPFSILGYVLVLHITKQAERTLISKLKDDRNS